MKFSKATKGFYPDSMQADYAAAGTLPADLQDISLAAHAALVAAQSAGKIIDWSGAAPVAIDPPAQSLASVKSSLSTSVDTKMAALYEKFTRFEREYASRETAARAFKAAGYTGDAGVWVNSFATAAGKTPKAAADLIIQQADAMYAALPVLGALRMRKYEIAAAATAANAQAIHDDILAAATAAAAGL